MRSIVIISALVLLVTAAYPAQQPPAPPSPPAPAVAPAPPAVLQPPLNLGKWWKNSQVVRELLLSEDQIKSLEKIFLDNRRRLGEMRAELRRQDAMLQSLLDSDSPDQKKIEDQTEQVLAARGNLERTNTAMMLAFRRAITAEQWRKLQDIRRANKSPQPVPPIPPAPPAPPAPPSFPLSTEPAQTIGKTASGDPIYLMSGPVRPPVLVNQPVPSYTPEAKEKKIEGLVILEGIVGKDGIIRNVKVLRGLGYGLDESAANTVAKEWRFDPGTLDGKPVNVRANIEISFRLF